MNEYLKDCQIKSLGEISRTDMDSIWGYFESNAPYLSPISPENPGQNLENRSLERPFCTKDSLLSSTASFKYLLHHCRPYLHPSRSFPPTQKLTIFDWLTRNNSDLDHCSLIIVVPSVNIAGNLSTGNCREFLEDGRYTVSSELVTGPVVVTKKVRDRWVNFEVFDRVGSFTQRQWMKVVAVFLHNPKYQLKDWPGYQSPSKIFERVKGFYLKYSDGCVEEEVQRWAVTVLEVGRTRRHLDIIACTEFWRQMEAFLGSYRER